MTTHVPTQADEEILKCLKQKLSFSVVAGAGSGKTTSLVEALKSLLETEGARMLRDGQQVVCITYTNRAVEVIRDKLRQSPLFVVSTLHSFLWAEIRHFSRSIRVSLQRSVLPIHIAKQKENDNGGKSKKATEARAKVAELEQALEGLDSVPSFRYGYDNTYSNYLQGEIGHDDLVLLAADMIRTSGPLRRVLGQKYPYIFVDEAQDTFSEIVAAFNALCPGGGLPVVGYFGDPMQQIHDKGMDDFAGPPGSKVVTKKENYRSAPEVIALLNAFRKDVTQIAAGNNSFTKGSVGITLVQAETPEAARNRYSEDQLERAQSRLAKAIELWGWTQRKDAKLLFLARRMIARRLGFLSLHELFNGPYTSSRAKNAYESGEHYLLKPLIETVIPLARARRERNAGAVMRVLTTNTVAFRPGGAYTNKSIRDVREIASQVTATLANHFDSSSIGVLLRYCSDQGIIRASERLISHFDRPPRVEEYNDVQHADEKSDWLADAFFRMEAIEVENYCNFLEKNTPFSTQHGVKGEEYEDVIVVFDDAEAAWNDYSFAKMLTPQAAGEPKDSVKERSRKLAYVCFSRAVRNLRVLLFTPDPKSAALELIDKRLFQDPQITILDYPPQR